MTAAVPEPANPGAIRRAVGQPGRQIARPSNSYTPTSG